MTKKIKSTRNDTMLKAGFMQVSEQRNNQKRIADAFEKLNKDRDIQE